MSKKITMFRYEYDKSSKKFSCPSCGQKSFVRLIDNSTGSYAPDGYGKCDRASKCGFKDWPSAEEETEWKPIPRRTIPAIRPFDYLDTKHAVEALGNYEENGLVQFLLKLFPYDHGAVSDVLAKYLVGTYPDTHGAYTLLPYLDAEKRLCYGKLIRFNPRTGRRGKGQWDTHSLKAKLKIEPFNRKVTFFGEHLLAKHPTRPVSIVEAEKSAIIATLCDGVFPHMVWLATGSLSVLTPERIARIGRGRRVVLFPDAGAYQAWEEKAVRARKMGVDVVTSDLIEKHATEDEMSRGFDIADYLIREQEALNVEAEESHAIYLEGNGWL